jgi:hypothetical protein
VNGRQHGACHIVGIDLIPGQHEQGWSGMGLSDAFTQYRVSLCQAITGGVMRFAAGTKHQIIGAAGQHKVGPGLSLMQ